MKIARELAEYIEGRQCPGGAMSASSLEFLIAAKLKPVREALDRAAHRFEYLYFGGIEKCNGIDTVVASQDVRATISLFEDD